MKPKHAYLLLCVAGAVVPYTQFVPWLLKHGPSVRLFLDDLFANQISAFFAMDVIVSAAVVFVFAAAERTRLGRAWCIPIIAVCVAGVSLGLPLLLYLREREPRARVSAA